jgi:hypothetical protein
MKNLSFIIIQRRRCIDTFSRFYTQKFKDILSFFTFQIIGIYRHTPLSLSTKFIFIGSFSCWLGMKHFRFVIINWWLRLDAFSSLYSQSFINIFYYNSPILVDIDINTKFFKNFFFYVIVIFLLILETSLVLSSLIRLISHDFFIVKELLNKTIES